MDLLVIYMDKKLWTFTTASKVCRRYVPEIDSSTWVDSLRSYIIIFYSFSHVFYEYKSFIFNLLKAYL